MSPETAKTRQLICITVLLGLFAGIPESMAALDEWSRLWILATSAIWAALGYLEAHRKPL